MSLEIEVKYRVTNHDSIHEVLASAGAKRVGVYLETNRLFDLPDGDLRKRGEGLRIRTVTTVDGAPQADTLTYKGPRAPGELKIREEIETEIGGADHAAGILAAIGFVETLRFEKRRETWRLNGATIELDTLPEIGAFIEIESTSEDAVRAVAERLRLPDADRVSDTYVALLAARGVDARPAVFCLRKN